MKYVSGWLHHNRISITCTKAARRYGIAISVGLVALAAALRIYGIDWGLPEVYVEETPLKKAWEMWDWGQSKGIDLNPHFFNYPSLTIYLQFAAQGIFYIFLKLFGSIESAVDFEIAYLFDKTPFHIVGRSINVFFGVASVWITHQMTRRIAGSLPAAIAACLVAVNTFHISRSQIVEVDVPLTFFVMLSLWILISLAEDPTLKKYILAGLAIGLAASSKYTGALLLLPLLLAHITTQSWSRRIVNSETGKKRKGRWTHFVLAVGVAVVVFLVTSPFVVLDFSSFREHMWFEQQHMRLGHFGSDTQATWRFYASSLTETLLGWPLLVMSVLGLLLLAGGRRQIWALVLASFVVLHVFVVGAWTMHAPRYLLPIVPLMAIFGATVLVHVLRSPTFSRLPSASRLAVTTAIILLLLYPSFRSYAKHLNHLKPRTQTMAKQWVEDNIPQGSYIALEYHCPEFFNPMILWDLSQEARDRIKEREEWLPFFAVQFIPMFSVKPEQSAVFYDLELYESADVVITSSIVKNRYLRDPTRFRRQVAFYNSLELNYDKVAEFRPNGNLGPVLSVYRNPRQKTPFGERSTVTEPSEIESSFEHPTGREGMFYVIDGLNYETFNFHEAALLCYERGLRYHHLAPNVYTWLTKGAYRCLQSLGRSAEAEELLKKAGSEVPVRKVFD